MALKDTWVDKINDVDDVNADDINEIAHSVIEFEIVIEDIEKALDEIINIQNDLLGIKQISLSGLPSSDAVVIDVKNGMTWEEWVDSEYNNIGAYIEGDGIIVGYGDTRYSLQYYNTGFYVSGSDPIDINEDYYFYQFF